MTKEMGPRASRDLAKVYEPKPEECAQVAAYADRQKQKPIAPRVTLADKDRTRVSIAHPMPALGQTLAMYAIGVTDLEFFDGLLGQLVNVGTYGTKPDERGLNFMLAMMRAFAPNDEVESMLAAQMAAVHMAIMTFARRLNHADNIAQQDSAERAFNKLARTFAVQLEALKRYRAGGEQRVTVQHVTVNEGGQAIVGPVSPTAVGTGGPKNAKRPHERHTCHAP